MGLVCWPSYAKIRELNLEKSYWQAQLELQRPGVQETVLPTLMELPTTIEACQQVFQEENVQVLTVNLDRIETESREALDEQDAGLCYALFHFKLSGSWKGIENAFQRLENVSDQIIHIQEVRLNPEGGDSVLKIYFYEPNKLDQP